MPLLLMFIAVLSVSAETRNVLDKTFPRDNAVCYINGKRMEIIIRGNSKYTEPEEKGFGEHVLYTVGTKRGSYKSLPINRPHSDTFSFFKGKKSLCSRTQGFMVGQDRLAVLFLKENRPHHGKLMIQFFDARTLDPQEVLATSYLSDKVERTNKGFSFVSYSDRMDLDMGKVIIEGQDFTYQDRSFPVWLDFAGADFTISLSRTFDKFPLKRFFTAEEEFRKAAGWNSKRAKFDRPVVYIAVNHALKRECLLFTAARTKFDGTEEWRCQDKKAQ